VGGFLLPTILGGMKSATGSYAAGFLLLAAVACGAVFVLRGLMTLRRDWGRSWNPGVATPAAALRAERG
jgi:NNP family nitrate/nitrite transporter-like MFS transporter